MALTNSVLLISSGIVVWFSLCALTHMSPDNTPVGIWVSTLLSAVAGFGGIVEAVEMFHAATSSPWVVVLMSAVAIGTVTNRRQGCPCIQGVQRGKNHSSTPRPV